ncbi:comta [Symbiodinium microadriaticum]|nr:comta [Symbiodinium microadriaticum]
MLRQSLRRGWTSPKRHASAAAKAALLRLLQDARTARLPPDGFSFQVPASVVGAVLADCEHARRWREVLLALRSIRATMRPRGPSLLAYNTAIFACQSQKNWELVVKILLEMRHKRCQPDAKTCSRAILACGQLWQQALAFNAYLQLAGVKPNSITTSALISSCARASRWQLSLAFVEFDGASSTAVFNAAMTACVKGSKWPAALLLLRRISALHLLPDLFSFNVAIHGCEVGGGAWVTALQLLEEMSCMMLQPDLVSINSCISTCAEGLRWAAAVQLFGQMADRQVQPDLVSYNAAMSAVGRGQLWRAALQLLQALPCKPNMISFNTAMAACERAGHWKHVIALLEKLRDNKMTPDMRTWTSLVASFSRASDWVKAQSILTEIRLQDLDPDLVIFGAMATAFQRGHQWALALSLLPETHNLQVVPDERLCGSIVTACAASQAWQAALSCLVEFPRRNLQPTSTSSSPVLTALLDVQQWLMALHLFEHLQHVVAMDSQAYGRLLLVCEQHQFTEWQHRLLQSLASPRGPARHTPGRLSLAAAVAAQSAGLGMVPAVSRESAPDPASIPRAHSWTPYVKEIRLMEHVLRNAERGNPHSVCDEVESFGRHVSGSSKTWLKVAGGEKSEVLWAAAQHARSSLVLEIGTYCGNSSIRIATASPNIRVVTLEADPVHAVIARAVIAFAGLSSRVWTGHSREVLPYMQGKYGGARGGFGLVFMDQRGSRYQEDLTMLESLGLVRPGAIIVADNVLKPGAPLFLWQLCKSAKYQTQVVRVSEFAMPVEDWMLVCRVGKQSMCACESLACPPAALVDLDQAADLMRRKAQTLGGVSFSDWAEFTTEMREGLRQWGIMPTTDANGLRKVMDQHWTPLQEETRSTHQKVPRSSAAIVASYRTQS